MEEKKTMSLIEKVKEKVKKTREKARETKESMFHFLAENPQITISLFSALGTIGIGGAMMVSKAARRHEEACRVEDDVTGEHFLLEHPLSNEEILELNRRMIDGEAKAEILQEMGLLR